MTDTNSADPDRSATAAPGAELHQRSFMLDVAREVTATVVSGGVLALGKVAAEAAVDKIREVKHVDRPAPPSGQLGTPAD
jgi:hypothetical protein